jgi:bacteriocin-like protein
MKKKLVVLEEAKQAKRVHPLSAEELANVTGGITMEPAPLPLPGAKPQPVPRDWGWW